MYFFGLCRVHKSHYVYTGKIKHIGRTSSSSRKKEQRKPYLHFVFRLIGERLQSWIYVDAEIMRAKQI